MAVLPKLLLFAAIALGGEQPSNQIEPRAELMQPSGPGLWIGGLSFGRQDISSAEQTWDGYSGTPTITVTFTETGREKFLRAQEGRVGQPIEITVDGELISSPHLMEPIEGHQMMISGTFTVDEAKAIARRLRGSPANR